MSFMRSALWSCAPNISRLHRGSPVIEIEHGVVLEERVSISIRVEPRSITSSLNRDGVFLCSKFSL